MTKTKIIHIITYIIDNISYVSEIGGITMPAKKKVPKNIILQAALDIVREKGIEAVNARSIAQKLRCSTQPIYLSFKGMNELKVEVFQMIDTEYNSFFTKHIDTKNYLVSVAKSHILFALEEKNLYKAMFLSNIMDGVSLEDVANAVWNKSTVLSVVKDFQIDELSAKKLFVQMWLFSSGLAVQLATNNMKVDENDIDLLLNDFYERLGKSYATE